MSPPISPSDGPELDPLRIIDTLRRHDVDYLLVGGLAAGAHGATRATYDFDALAEPSGPNLERLAAALRELGAFYRVAGLSDDEARVLPTRIDRHTLRNAAISTWRTDAGDLDVMTEMPVGANDRRTYSDLIDASATATLLGGPVRIAALDDIIASKRHADRSKDRAALPELDRLARQARDSDMDDDDRLGID